ncbi:MAG: hypothetical protein CML18_03565 [Pusillimonas sp.]|jgi:hypothetical protein|nr:hypothetical protein [Pusillimonas sp.]|tara:strand:+ start:1543 stop:2343 length:801 start_codon:yes stop_codon:yes gene_type:complete
MQAAILPITAGWQWIIDGFNLFRRQPLAMFFWSLMTGLLITLTYLIPLFGQIFLIAAMPSLTYITLNACRQIEAGRPMLPGMWLTPLKDAQARAGLIRLGLAYLACCLAAGFIATLPFLDQIMAALNNESFDETALLSAIQGPFLTFGLLYILISALFWHAPALIGWHRLKMSQALFFSMVACWRNKFPFMLYGATWIGLFFVAQTLGDVLAASGLSATITQLIMTPINLVIAAILYCSFYPTYMSIFGRPAYNQADQTGSTPDGN